MGNLVRRVLAFVLGMVFTVSLAAGSVAGGAYWAYKTVKPLTAVTDKDSGLGDLREQTVEDLVALLQSAAAEPDKYTLARLADEYNIDFVKLLDKVGVKVDADKNKANWNALMGVSLFNLKDGIEPFLKSIPVRALYNFLSEEQLDNLLSREAQDKLGDYTVYELISKEEGETDVGAIKAVRTLSIGSLLPQYFEEKYDAVTHRSEYVLKDDCKIRVLEVFGNVSLGVISNMLAPGADFMTELLEGSLSSVAEMPIEDIIYDIAATISEDIGKEVKKYASVLNGAKISQLFTRNADGGYSFTYESVVKDLKIGCIFGLTDELGDGVWTNKNGEPVPDVLQELCNIDLGAIFDNDGTFDMINQLIGGVNVGMILDACKVEVGTPALDMIRKIEIGKLLEGQTDKFDVNKFLKSLVSNVRESVGDVTLSEIIGVTTGNAFVDKLLSFKISDFVLDEYSVKNILNALKSGFGDVCLGDVLNVTKGEGGEWNITGTAFEKLEFMKPLFDLSINNIINVADEITSNSGKVTASAIVEAIIPELKLGDIFVAIPGISKDEATGNYVITTGDISKVLPSGIGALLDMRVYQIVDGIENNNSQFDLYTILDNVKFGDFVSFADDLLNKGEKEYVYDEKSEKYVWKNDAASSTTKFMNVSVAEMVNDAFKNKFEKTLSTPVIAVTEFAAEMGKWVSRVSGLDKTLTEIDSQLDSLCGIVSGIFTPESTLKKATVADDVEAGVIVDGVRIILDTVNSFKTSGGKKIIPNAVYSAVDGIDEIIGGIKLKNFVEEIKAVEVSKVISVAASSVNDATENKYEEKVNAFAGVADTIAGGTLGDFRIRNFLVASAEGSAEQGLAEQIHNILIIYNVNNSSVDEMFVQLSEIYGGVRAKEFLDKNKNLEINQSVSAISSVIKTFFKDDANGTKVKDIIDGSVNVVEVVFRGKTFVKFGVADFDVSELTEKTETLSGLILGSSSQANKTICSVLGEFKTLYNGVKVSKFVEFSKDMPLENVINASTRIAKTAVADYSNGANTDFANDTLDDIAAMVNCVFEGSTLGKVKVAEDKYVVEFFNRVEDLTDNFLKDGTAAKTIVAKVYDEIEILYPTSTFNTIVNDSKNMLLANVVNAATDIVKTALTECKVKNAEKINDCITDFADLVNYTLEGSTLTNIKVYADKQIVEFVNKVEAITDNFLKDGSNEKTVVAEFYNEVKALYATTTLKTFVDDSKNMLLANVVNAVTGIVKTALTTYNVKNADKINDGITDFVDLVNYTLEGSTLTKIKVYADKEIVVFVDKVEAITDNAIKEGSKLDTVVSKVYDEIRTLYPTTTLKTFVEDSKAMPLANVTTAVADIATTSLTAYNVKNAATINGYIDDGVDLVNYIFEGSTLSKIKITNDKSVVELTNKVEAITDNAIKEGSKLDTVVSKVYDEIRTLYPTTTLKTFVEDSKAMPLANVTTAVADIATTSLTTYNVKNAETINGYIDDSVDLVNYIFEGSTLSKIKITNDKQIVELTNKVEAITDNAIKEGSKLDTVVSKVYDEIRTLYPTTTLKTFVADSKAMPLANVTTAVADIATTSLTAYNVKNAETINGYIDDSVDLVNYIFEGSTLSKIKITNDKTVVELTNKVEAITDNAIKEGSKLDTVVSKVYDEIRTLYPTTTLKTFVADSKAMPLANVTTAVADIVTTSLTTYNVKNATTINGYIDDSVDLVNYIFEGSTLSKIKVTNDKTVVELTNRVEAITDNAIKEGSKLDTVVSKVYDEIRTLYPTTTLKTFVADSKAMPLANVTTAVADIATTALTTYNVKNATTINGYIDDGVDLVNYIFEGSTLSKIKITNDKSVVELTNKVEAITDNAIKDGSKLDTVVSKVYDEIRTLYPTTTLKTFVEDSKAMPLANVTTAVADIVTTSLTTYNVKNATTINGYIDDSVDLVNYIFEGSTLSKIKVTNDKTVVELTNRVEAITDNAIKEGSKLDTVVSKVYDEIRTLYPTTTLKTFVADSKAMPLANVTTAVADIATTALTTYNVKNATTINGYIDDGVDLVNYIFEGSTLSKIKITNDKQIVELTNKVEAITDNAIKEGSKLDTVVSKVYDEIRTLYPTTTLKTFVADSKAMPLANVTIAVADIATTSLTAYNVKNAETINGYIDDSVELVNYIFEGSTLSKIKITNDKSVVELTNKVEAITDNAIKDGSKLDTVVSKVYDEIRTLYPTTTLKTFVADSKAMPLANVTTAVADIATTSLTAYNVKNATTINGYIDDSVDLVNYIFEGSTLSKIKITNDKSVVELTNRVEAITDNAIKDGSKLDTVVSKVYDEIRTLYPTTTLKTFVEDSKKLVIADVTVAAGEIVKVSVNKQKASDITDAVNDIVKVVFGTKTVTDSKPIVNFEVAKLSNEVKDLADIVITNNKAKTIIDEVAAQFASLYDGVIRSNFVTASGELQIADIVDSVDSIIKTCVTVSGNKDEVKINDGIDDLADLAKTLFGGTVKKPVIYNITVNDAADRAEAITDDIPMNSRVRETIACVYEEVRSLYDGKKLTEVGSASKALEFNAVVSSVSNITVTAAKNNVVTDVFDGIKGISSKLFTGTMSSVKISDFFIDELTNEVIAAADKAIGAGVPKDMLDETAAQFAYLFNGTRRSGFVTAAKNVDFGDLLHSVSEIAKKASTNSKYLSAVTDTVALAGELVSGKITAPKFADFEITGLANAVNAFVTDFVPDGKVKDVISKTIENFGDLYVGGTTRTTFVSDSKNLSIGDTIASVKEITDVAGVKIDRVYTLATVAIGGNDEHASTFAKPYFDMNGLWNEANTTEKIVGVGVGAAAGAGMYFLANDTLVKLAKNALGEEKLVGDLVAETLGYTKNESGKWTFEDDENELATTAFELRVCDVLKKGFDFKGTFEEKLNVANVALLGKAVNTKYDKKDNVKELVNGSLDEVVNLFGTADAKNYKEVIKAVKVDDVVDSLAAIAGIPSSGKYADKADHIAALLKEMLAGTLGKPGIESNMFIAPVVRGVKDVAADYIPDGKVKDIVSVTLENFASLYEYEVAGETEKTSYTFKEIKDGTKVIELKKLVASADEIIKTASSSVYEKAERWLDLAGQILGGTVKQPAVYIDKAWNSMSYKEKVVVAGVGGAAVFVAYNYFNDKFVSYLENQYGDRTLGSLIADNLGYGVNENGEYVLNNYGFVNPMMNEYFAEKIVTVASKSYDYKAPLRKYLTVGNVIAASGQTMHVYTKFAPVSFKLAQENGKWTIESDKYKTVAENVLAIAAFRNGKRIDVRIKDGIKEFVGDEVLANVYAGELLGKTKDGNGWLESEGTYASGISAAVYDIDAGKFIKGETTVDDVINGLTVGDVMTITNQSSGLLQRLKPVKVGDLADRIDGLRLGEAMSYVRVENGETVKWYEAEKDADGNYVIENGDFVAGTAEVTDEVVLAIADFTVKELSDGGFADKLMNAVKDITLGKVISVGDNKILKQLENVKIGNISTEINQMQVSKLLGYEKGTDGKWYETDENGNIDNSKEVTGVVTAFVDFTIGDLGSGDFGTKIKAKVNDLALGDVIEPAGNPILAALADKKIGNLATEANELKVGVMMGYTYDETAGVWYKDAEKTEVVTDDLMLMLAKYQVKDLNSGDFESKVTADIKQLKVSKFFGSYADNSNTIFGILSENDYNNATIDSLPDLMQSSMKTAKLGKLGDLGIVSLDDNTSIDTGAGATISIRTALNTVFSDQDADGEYLWENWDMSQLLTKLVQKAFDAARS